MKPIIDKSGIYPKNGKCPVCNKKLGGNFVTFCSGALFKVDKNQSIMDGDKLDCFGVFAIHFDKTDTYEHLQLAVDTYIGQYEIYTCSIDCMKTLFCRFLNDLEAKSKKKQKGKNANKKVSDNGND